MTVLELFERLESCGLTMVLHGDAPTFVVVLYPPDDPVQVIVCESKDGDGEDAVIAALEQWEGTSRKVVQ